MALQEVGVKLVLDQGSFFSDLGKANNEIANLGSKAQDSGGGFSALEKVATGALNRIGSMAIEAGAQLVQGIGKGIADSVTVAGDFEAAVNNLAAVSGTALADAGFNFDDVSQKALQLGIDTRYSASESIAAMTELVKGGVPVAEVMADATDNTLALAAAAGIELGPAAEIVAKQFGVWSETGVTTAQISDLLTQAANASTVGVEDLALGLANAGGTAKTGGVAFNELVQSMALLAPNFSSASDAGTSFKTFISRLVPSTTPAKDAMAELGLWTRETGSAFYDAQGQFIGMEAAAELLQTATANLSEEQRLQAFNTIFGSDAIRAAAAIANAGAEGFNAMGESMAGAGTAAETAAIQNQGFNFAMDSLKGSVETLQIVIGSALLPIITQLINDVFIPGVGVVTSFAMALFGNQEALASLSPPLQKAVGILQNLGAALVDAGPFSAEFAEALSLVHPALQPLMNGVSQVASFLQNNWQAAVAVAGGVLAALLVPALAAGAAAFGAAVVAAAPVIAIFAVVGTAAAALYGAWQSNFGGIQEATASAMAAVQSVIQSVLSIVSAFWAENGAEIMATAQRTWTQVQEIVGTVVAIVAEIVTRVFGTIASFLNEHGAEIQRTLEFAWNNIQSTIDLVMNTIQGIVTTILGIVTGDWETASAGIQQIVDGIYTYLTDTFNNIVSFITDLGPGFLAAAQSIGKSIIDGIVGGITAGAGAIASAAKSAAQSALDAAKGLLGIQSPSTVMADQVGLPVAQGIAQGILDGLPEIADAIEDLAGETKDAALAAFEDIGSAAAQMFDDALSGRAGLSRTRQKALKDFGKFQDELVELEAKRFESGEADQAYRRLSSRLMGAESLRGAAQREADEIARIDATAANEYLAMRESQINKILELEAERDKAQTNQQIARANRALELEREAQQVELQQFQVAMQKRQRETAALGNDFEETGVSLIDGMIKGIQERSSALSEALGEVMGNALRTAQQQLGIASPSLVFAQQVGMPITEGVAMGIQSAMPVALGAVADMASGLVRPAAPAVMRGGSVSNSTVNNFNYSPQYGSAPRQPTQDFAALRAFAAAR